jgi:hypothetical protein
MFQQGRSRGFPPTPYMSGSFGGPPALGGPPRRSSLMSCAGAGRQIRSPAGVFSVSCSGDQLRPAMTPPSTSTMAPVIQLDLSDSRNDTAFAMSSGLPTRPSG